MKNAFVFAALQKQLHGVRGVALAASLAIGSLGSVGGPHAQSSDGTDVVRKTIVNYKARQLKAREYAYGEADFIREKLFRGQLLDSELYEVIPLGDRLYRRHVAHNGRPLSPEEERNEQQGLEHAIQQMEENFQKRVENPAAIHEDGAPRGTPISEISWGDPFEFWQLDLASLPSGFSFRMLGEEVLENRKVFVVEGKPMEDMKWAGRGKLDLQNFDIKLWIDEQELELVKLEARARKKGLLATPEHATVNRQKFQGAMAQGELDSLYESTLWYGRGTLLIREWTKVNGEVWLPSSLHVKGKKSHERDYPNGDHGSGTWSMEQQTTYSNYHKFRVTHRVVPDFSVKDPASPKH